MNMNSPRPASKSPVSGQTDSIVSSSTLTDVQDLVSSHNNTKRDPNSEYKSNFTPFDQYVYDEIRDSFVKSNNLATAGADTILSHSSSNHELGASSSPSLVFEPTANGYLGGQHGSAERPANSPWYNEVIKRNEKASEYRYKSELGHTSPLVLKTSTSNEDLARRSPLLGNDPAIEAQLMDVRQQTQRPNYKRDHLISYMANNNNFNLPKAAERDSSGRVPLVSTTRRPQVSSTTGNQRTATRSAAHDRARSQSSRRQLVSASNSKAQPTSKSNQTTPTKSVPARVATAERPTASARSQHHVSTTSRQAVGATTTSANRTANGALSTRVQATGNGVSARPKTAISKSRVAPPAAKPPLHTGKTPVVSSSSDRPATARLTSTSATRTKPATNTTTTRGPSSSSSTKTPITKSPVKRVAGTPTSSTATGRGAQTVANRSIAARSATKSTAAKASPSTSAAAPTVKSIKTPKALADAEEKAAAATALATATVGSAAVATVDATNSKSESNQTVSNNNEDNQHSSAGTLIEEGPHKTFEQAIKLEPEMHYEHEHQVIAPTQSTDNLLYTTTEAGIMLADELAQAEQASNTAVEVEQQGLGHQVDLIRQNEWTPSRANEKDIVPKDDEEENFFDNNNKVKDDEADILEPYDDTTLVNGLAGGLISADDRFDSSERGASSDTQEGTRDAPVSETFSQTQHSQNYDDEPYSIMPTYDVGKKAALSTIESVGNSATLEEEKLEEHMAEIVEKENENQSDVVRHSDVLEKEDDRLDETESTKIDTVENNSVIPVLGEDKLTEHLQKQDLDLQEQAQQEFDVESQEQVNNHDLINHKQPIEENQKREVDEEPKISGDEPVDDQHPKDEVSDDEQVVETPFIQESSVNQKALTEELSVGEDVKDASNVSDHPNLPESKLELASQFNEDSEQELHLDGEDLQESKPQNELAEVSFSRSKRVSFDDSTHEIKHDERLLGNISTDELQGEQEEIISTIEEKEPIVQESETFFSEDTVRQDSINVEQDLDSNASADSIRLMESNSPHLNIETKSNDDDLNHILVGYSEDPVKIELFNQQMENDKHEEIVPDLIQTEPTPESDPSEDTREEVTKSSADDVNQIYLQRDDTISIPTENDTVSSKQEDDYNKRESIDELKVESSDLLVREEDRQLQDDLERHNSSKNELLMNVAELAQFEIRRKEEMTRKSELARQNSLAKSPLSPVLGEVLLSPDQLDDQFLVNLSDEKKTQPVKDTLIDGDDIEKVSSTLTSTEKMEDSKKNSAYSVEEVSDEQTTLPISPSKEHSNLENSDGFEVKAALGGSKESIGTGSAELLKFDSSISSSEQVGQMVEREVSQSQEKTQVEASQNSDIDNDNSPLKLMNNSVKGDLWNMREDEKDLKESEAMLLGIVKLGNTKNMTTNDDDIDGEEHLKFSNPLTNSDDELILESHNRTTTSNSNSN